MAGKLRKAMIYLGLAEDEARYDAYDVDDDVDDDLVDEPVDEGLWKDRQPEEHRASVTPLRKGRVAGGPPVSGADLHRITTIHPRTYNEARTIGEAFRSGAPVIMNLSEMEDADAKRLVDFAAGLIFGLHGSIERITTKVFLLSPANAEFGPARHRARAPGDSGAAEASESVAPMKTPGAWAMSEAIEFIDLAGTLIGPPPGWGETPGAAEDTR